MKQFVAFLRVLVTSWWIVFFFAACGTDTITTCPPPACPTCPAPEQPEFNFTLTSWFEPDKFVIQGTSYLGEPSAAMLTLPAKFKTELGKGENTPSYIVKLLESEIRNEQTLQADWAANSGYSQVKWTSPVSPGDVQLDGGGLTGGLWTQKTSGATIRAGHSAIVHNGKMYVFGGYNGGSYLNDVWEYDLTAHTWAQKTSGATIRAGHSAIVHNGKMYVFGGYNGGSYLNDVWEYDLTAHTWAQKTSGASIRNRHSAVVYNGKMYVFGGSNVDYLNDVWEYDLTAHTWAQKTSGASIRNGHSAVVYNGKMYIFGGGIVSSPLNDVWEYNLTSHIWTQKTSGASIRYRHSAIVYNDKMYVFGGFNGSISINTVWEYNLTYDVWLQKTSGASIRWDHSSVLYSGKFYVFGGYDNGTYLNDAWEDFVGYFSPGYIQTKVMDLGSMPAVDGQWRFQNLIPAGTSVAYEAWALDFLNWTSRSMPTGTYRGVAWNGSVFAAVGASVAATSSDGITWYARTIPAGTYHDITWNGSVFVAVGDNVAATSSDGITWYARTIPAGVYYGVAWNGSVFAAVGINVAASSSDGITWNTRTIPAGTYRGVAWNGTVFAAVGDSVAASSSDGITWNTRTIPAGYYRGVAWSGTVFAAVGDSVAASSSDGIAWNTRTIPAGTYRGLAWNGAVFAAVGVNVAAIASDGITWSPGTIPTGDYYHAAAWNGLVVAAVGDNNLGATTNFTSLGAVIDGQAITVRSQYYAVKATLTADTAQATSPTLRSIMARFPTYRGYSDNPLLGYEAAIQSVSALSTKISDTDPSSISQVTVNLAFTQSVSDYLKTKYPKNKEVRLLAGFMADGFVEADYYEYYRGLIDDWGIEEKDIVSVKIKDFSRLWDVPVPKQWQSSSDDITWTALHPVDVMLDVFRGYIGSTDAELDQTSFDAVKLATPGWVVTRTITGNTIAAKDLLEELRKLMSAYFIPQPNGRIKLARFDASAPTVGSLSDQDFLSKKWEGNAGSLINQLNVYFGHAENPTYPTTAELGSDDFANFHAWDLSEDAASKTNWQEVVTEEIKDKWTRIAQSGQVAARRGILLTRYANPPEKLTVTVDMRHMEFETGDPLDITTLRAPSSDMSGISAKVFQVVQKTPDFTRDRLSLTLLRRGAT